MTFRLAAVFSDNCVLQREKNIMVFGEGEEGRLVEAALSGPRLDGSGPQESRGSAYVRGGRFEIKLPPLQAGVEHTLRVSCGGECIVRKMWRWGRSGLPEDSPTWNMSCRTAPRARC